MFQFCNLLRLLYGTVSNLNEYLDLTFSKITYVKFPLMQMGVLAPKNCIMVGEGGFPKFVWGWNPNNFVT